MPKAARKLEKSEEWLDFVEARIHDVRGRELKGFDRRTLDEVFDRATMLTLFKLLNDGALGSLDYPISTGKEANVFHGTTPAGAHVAAKIFRTSNATFHNMLPYIEGDPRFTRTRGTKRSIVHLWASKEYRNLQKMFEAGVRVPRPITSRENILVMEFIGTDGTPAPALKDVALPDPAAACDELLGVAETLWRKAGLVHGDLSEYNVLVQGDALVVIDVGQGVVTEHPNARELLARDVRNLVRYFSKFGVGRDADRIIARIAPLPKAGAGEDEEEDDQ